MEEEPKHNCYYDLEDHFKKLEATGELFRKWLDEKSKMTREEAIAKLKEAKELMDIEMISKEEFDALKKELAPIIMDK